MPAIASDYRKIIQLAAAVAVALLVVSASHVPSQAQGGHMLVIPASDGYGFDDCLSSNKACGHTIADAWCEAHGLAASISFGKAEDITAAIGGKADSKASKVDPNAYVVNCRD